MCEQFSKTNEVVSCQENLAVIIVIANSCVSVSRSVVSDSLRPQGSPPGSSVLEISQAGVLEWAAISSSRASSPHQGWDPRLLHGQAASLLLCLLGSPANSCVLLIVPSSFLNM